MIEKRMLGRQEGHQAFLMDRCEQIESKKAPWTKQNWRRMKVLKLKFKINIYLNMHHIFITFNKVDRKMKKGLSAVIFGGTGAVGLTLVSTLLESQKWDRVHCVVRKTPQAWEKAKKKQKLTIQVEQDMDKLFKTQEWKLEGYDAMFVCFGSQVKHGEETFVKIDKTYPLLCADIAINNKIPHYLIVSSSGGDPDSMFLYMKVKGQVEKQLKEKKVNIISVLKPGLIKNRPDARFGEKVAQFFSFLPFPAVECLELALALMTIVETKQEEAEKEKGVFTIYENKDILNVLPKKK